MVAYSLLSGAKQQIRAFLQVFNIVARGLETRVQPRPRFGENRSVKALAGRGCTSVPLLRDTLTCLCNKCEPCFCARTSRLLQFGVVVLLRPGCVQHDFLPSSKVSPNSVDDRLPKCALSLGRVCHGWAPCFCCSVHDDHE